MLFEYLIVQFTQIFNTIILTYPNLRSKTNMFFLSL